MAGYMPVDSTPIIGALSKINYNVLTASDVSAGGLRMVYEGLRGRSARTAITSSLSQITGNMAARAVDQNDERVTSYLDGSSIIVKGVTGGLVSSVIDKVIVGGHRSTVERVLVPSAVAFTNSFVAPFVMTDKRIL